MYVITMNAVLHNNTSLLIQDGDSDDDDDHDDEEDKDLGDCGDRGDCGDLGVTILVPLFVVVCGPDG